MSRLGQNFEVNGEELGGGSLVDRGADFLDVLGFGWGIALADFAVEVPEIDAFGEGFFAFAFEVFPHLAFDLLDHPRGLMVRGAQGKYFFHVEGLCREQTGLSSGEIGESLNFRV